LPKAFLLVFEFSDKSRNYQQKGPGATFFLTKNSPLVRNAG
jgi:hypothetical protein